MIRICLPLTTALLIACSYGGAVGAVQTGEGKRLAFDRNKGNCLACHAIADGEDPGNIGPPLHSLKARYRSKRQLREQIDDATRFNPETSMPPFGKNKILSDDEIDKIVDYLWTLP
ncbi:MAG: sulfur oxidation c-type cytochrome SoxX [Gammaproteobacteria bacterium]